MDLGVALLGYRRAQRRPRLERTGDIQAVDGGRSIAGMSPERRYRAPLRPIGEWRVGLKSTRSSPTECSATFKQK